LREVQSLALIFLIVRPNRTREYGRQLLELLTSQGGIYPPEEVEVWKQGETFERVKFLPEIQNTILDEWEGLRGPTKTFNLLRWNPVQVQIIVELDDFANFDSLSLHVAKSYFADFSNLSGFLEISRKLYSLLSPCYGDLSTWEMHRRVKSSSVESWPGTDLVRKGLPGIYWANFFGPEYVGMFGRNQLFSAPCFKVEELPVGGALLILTESPLDFERGPSVFEHRRDAVRRHLGIDAFYGDDSKPATRFPNFRFWKERQALVEESLRRWKSQRGSRR